RREEPRERPLPWSRRGGRAGPVASAGGCCPDRRERSPGRPADRVLLRGFCSLTVSIVTDAAGGLASRFPAGARSAGGDPRSAHPLPATEALLRHRGTPFVPPCHRSTSVAVCRAVCRAVCQAVDQAVCRALPHRVLPHIAFSTAW